MAQKVQVVLTCDLDEDEVPAVQTVTFGYDGSNYAFELCEQHLEEVTELFSHWMRVARLANGAGRRRRSAAAAPAARPRRSTGPSGATSDIRKWARNNGFSISERGRIPAEVRRAYEEANP
ncbi:MAG: histone-like nucleoid-structuring protein Lsr2 [Acidimicrobiales bacterium]